MVIYCIQPSANLCFDCDFPESFAVQLLLRRGTREKISLCHIFFAACCSRRALSNICLESIRSYLSESSPFLLKGRKKENPQGNVPQCRRVMLVNTVCIKGMSDFELVSNLCNLCRTCLLDRSSAPRSLSPADAALPTDAKFCHCELKLMSYIYLQL